jgi:hypothetical protein
MIAHYAYDFIGSVDFRQMFQFDVRGTNQVIGITNIEIVIGEIKGGEGLKCAIIQLIERLLILRKAAVCMTNMPSNNIYLRGEIFTNIREWKVNAPTSNEDLEEIMTEMKIKQTTIDEIFQSQAGLIIDIEVIGCT